MNGKVEAVVSCAFLRQTQKEKAQEIGQALEYMVAENDALDYDLEVLLEHVKELDYWIVEMEQMQGF